LGLSTIILNGDQATGVWTPQNTPQEISQKRTVTPTLQPLGENLSVQVRNTFWPDANSKPHSNDFKYIFARQP